MQKLTNEEITDIETALGVPLPRLYRRLLIESGFGQYGQKADCVWNTTKEIHHPLAIRELYAAFVEDPTLLLAPYFPFGWSYETQDLWVINAETEKAATIGHETHPDDWPEEEWMSYDDWMVTFKPPEQVS